MSGVLDGIACTAGAAGEGAGVSRRPTEAQRRAADPTRSVWVTAHAGTGKTAILTDRVLRLLLAGAAPEGLLAVTFTKAAAAEMILRVETRLAAWAGLDPATLAGELETLTGGPPDAAMIARARTLFAVVLELPRGLPITTIHAFCAGLLRRFPLEAGVAPHFETIDERSAAELRREARHAVLVEAAAAPASPLGLAMERLAIGLAEQTLDAALDEALDCRIRLGRARAQQDGLEGLLAAVARALDLEPGTTREALIERACRSEDAELDLLAAAAEALAGSKTPTDQRTADLLRAWRGASPAERSSFFDRHCDGFLTKSRAPFAEKSFMTKAVREPHRLALAREQARLHICCDRLKALRLVESLGAFLTVAYAVIDAYEGLKARRAALDYDDLIERSRLLLEAEDAGRWVGFKLDAQLQHLLVDEAQDTSPAQWRIVELLAEELFAGEGQHSRPRTLFVVGDEKQSIYSFQGADLPAFQAARARLAARASGGLDTFPVDRSFRSGPAVLELVDATFGTPAARFGLGDPNAVLRHEPWRSQAAGHVELWPLMAHPEAEEEQPWPLPDRPRHPDDAARRLAGVIAETIAGWLLEGEMLESEGRPIRPDDIMILLARRSTLQELLIRALRQRGVPVAGADRLSLGEPIAVQDLLAVAAVALLPDDELSLAALLKSPLVGLDEDALFDLANERGPRSLRQRLREAGREEPARFADAAALVESWVARADYVPPFEFFTDVLNGRDASGRTGRERMLARLGADAIEPVEAFLAQTLAFESGRPASLQGFVAWFDAGSGELRRETEKVGAGVRIVTVHGAKGLESPIVFLADAGPYQGPNRERLVWHVAEGAGPLDAGLPLWRASATARDRVTGEACDVTRDRQRQERRRLLYVAMTRARDRLYVTGCLPARTQADPKAEPDEPDDKATWHELVAAGMGSLAEVELHPAPTPFTGSIARRRAGLAMAAAAEAAAAPTAAPPLPAFLRETLPDEAPGLRPMAPSRLAVEGAPDPEAAASADGSDPRAVGTAVHRLLELLPPVAPERREAALATFLRRAIPPFDPAVAARIERAVRAVLDNPELAALFGPASRAEQAIGGTVAGTTMIGQVDRLALLPDEVIVADYKTSRRPPATPEQAPVAYLRQMAAYRSLLTALWPDRSARLALVWTETGAVMWLPPALLDAHAPAAGTTPLNPTPQRPY